MSSIPSIMKVSAQRMSGYSSVMRKVTPMGKTSGIQPLDSIRFVLPSSSLLDLRTLKLHFKGVTSSTNNTAGAVLFPAPISGIIDQIVVTINGVQIESTPTQYGNLVKLIEDFSLGKEVRRARLNHNESLKGLSSQAVEAASGENFWNYVAATGNTFATATSLVPGTRDNGKFKIDSFPGSFLGTVTPRILSSSILGDIMVEFRMAPAAVLVSSAVYNLASGNTDVTPVAPTYTLNDVYMTVRTIDLAGSSYYSALKSEIESKALELPFTHWSGCRRSTQNHAERTCLSLHSRKYQGTRCQ